MDKEPNPPALPVVKMYVPHTWREKSPDDKGEALTRFRVRMFDKKGLTRFRIVVVIKPPPKWEPPTPDPKD